MIKLNDDVLTEKGNVRAKIRSSITDEFNKEFEALLLKYGFEHLGNKRGAYLLVTQGNDAALYTTLELTTSQRDPTEWLPVKEDIHITIE